MQDDGTRLHSYSHTINLRELGLPQLETNALTTVEPCATSLINEMKKTIEAERLLRSGSECTLHRAKIVDDFTWGSLLLFLVKLNFTARRSSSGAFVIGERGEGAEQIPLYYNLACQIVSEMESFTPIAESDIWKQELNRMRLVYLEKAYDCSPPEVVGRFFSQMAPHITVDQFIAVLEVVYAFLFYVVCIHGEDISSLVSKPFLMALRQYIVEQATSGAMLYQYGMGLILFANGGHLYTVLCGGKDRADGTQWEGVLLRFFTHRFSELVVSLAQLPVHGDIAEDRTATRVLYESLNEPRVVTYSQRQYSLQKWCITQIEIHLGEWLNDDNVRHHSGPTPPRTVDGCIANAQTLSKTLLRFNPLINVRLCRMHNAIRNGSETMDDTPPKKANRTSPGTPFQSTLDVHLSLLSTLSSITGSLLSEAQRDDTYFRSLSATRTWCECSYTIYFGLLAISADPLTPLYTRLLTLHTLYNDFLMVSESPAEKATRNKLKLKEFMQSLFGQQLSRNSVKILDVICALVCVNNVHHLRLVREARNSVLERFKNERSVRDNFHGSSESVRY